MALMFIIFYIYAAVGSLIFEDINPVLWGDISIAMLTLFRVMTLEDWTDVMYETMAVYSMSWVLLYFIYIPDGVRFPEYGHWNCCECA